MEKVSNLKQWLANHKFKQVDCKFGLGVWENNLGEKIFTDENFDIADYDLLSKTKKDMLKNSAKGAFNVVCI